MNFYNDVRLKFHCAGDANKSISIRNLLKSYEEGKMYIQTFVLLQCQRFLAICKSFIKM